jgi:hypothetical protein
MAAIHFLLAAHILTAAILTLVMPLAVLIVVSIWYVVLFLRGAGER